MGFGESPPHSGGGALSRRRREKIGFFGRFLAVFKGKTENFRPPEAAGPKMTPPIWGGLFSQILGFGGSGGGLFSDFEIWKVPPIVGRSVGGTFQSFGGERGGSNSPI